MVVAQSTMTAEAEMLRLSAFGECDIPETSKKRFARVAGLSGAGRVGRLKTGPLPCGMKSHRTASAKR